MCVDCDGYRIKQGGLVLFSEEVWKVHKISKSNGNYFLVLSNVNARETGIDPKDVQWLSEDTITDKPPKNYFEAPMLAGDFFIKKRGSNAVCQVIDVYKTDDMDWCLVYVAYYGGSKKTGFIYARETRKAFKPKYWDKQKQIAEGRNKKKIDKDGYEVVEVDDNYDGGMSMDPPGGGGYFSRAKSAWDKYFGPSHGPAPMPPPPRKPRKRDAIPTSEMIEDEARKLANQERRDSQLNQKETPPKLKGRKGEW